MEIDNRSLLDDLTTEEKIVGYLFCSGWSYARDFSPLDDAARREVSLLDTGAVFVKSKRANRFYSCPTPSSRARIDILASQHYSYQFSEGRRFIVSKRF